MEECMKPLKRILSGMLAAAMTLSAASMISVSAANIQFTDVSEHWAWTNGQIPYLVEKGVLQGYEQANGTYMFKPDGNVKRSEFIKMLDETFGLTKTAAINYTDMTSGDWYYPYFQKAAAQGYIIDYGTKANPTGEITREEATALLVRYLELPANEKADASTFADYSSINASYSEYVLRAVHAGIINGISEDGKTYFKPTKTLTRAEALTILYRAAGCIFNESANYRSGKAHSANNTITDTDITVSNTVFSGRNIITEGASGGKITLTGCSFKGSLFVRGSASIILDDCDVKELILLGGGDVTLVGGTKIETVDVKVGTTFNTYAGTKIDTLNVEHGADFTRVNGDGTVSMAYIRANNFSSKNVPTEFEIGNNLTANFNDEKFQGNSDAQNAFALEPFSTADDYYYYLNITPGADGTIYYYYTNQADTPSANAFDSHYSNARYYGAFDVKNGEPITHETVLAANASEFNYVVVQLRYDNRKYAPVLVENVAAKTSSFKTEPYVSGENTVSFHAETGGTVYWFYAADGKNLTQLEFLTQYEAKESALKNTLEVSSIRSFSCSLNDKYLANYGFAAFMLVTGGNIYHKPVVVPVGNDGFSTDPIVKTPGVISFKSSVSGEVYYYYSANADLPAAADFKKMHNAADNKGSEDIYANVESTVSYNLAKVEQFPYMIMSIRDRNGNFMLPVVVDINYTTGYRDAPEATGTDIISFRTQLEGSVRYYYTASDIAPTIEVFNSTYDQQNLRYKGSKSVTYFTETINYNSSYAVSFPYMAIMFTDETGKEYSPVLVSLDVTENTGLYSAPYVKDGKVYVSPQSDGAIYYFYSKDGSSVSPDLFEEEYDSTSSSRTGYFYVDADVLESFELDSDLIKKYPYIVIAFTDEPEKSHPDFGIPYVVEIAVSEADNAGSGVTVGNFYSDGSIKVTVEYEGDLYWYCTDSVSDIPSNRVDFSSKYASADKSDRIRDLDAGEVTYLEFYDYTYVVCALKVGDEFLSSVVIHKENGEQSGGISGILSDYNKNSYGFEFEGWSKDELTVISSKNGHISLLAVQSGKVDVIETQSVTIGEEAVFDIRLTQNNIISSLLFDIEVKFYLQLTDDAGNTYKPRPLSELN